MIGGAHCKYSSARIPWNDIKSWPIHLFENLVKFRPTYMHLGLQHYCLDKVISSPLILTTEHEIKVPSSQER